MLRPDHIETIEFAKGVEGQVSAKFPEALFTTIPAQDTTSSLEEMLFKMELHPGLEGELPLFRLAVASRAIYLPGPVNGYVETYNSEEEIDLRQLFMDDTERGNTEQVLEGLDQIEGVRWEIPSTIILARILLNHLQDKGEYLLSREYVWTHDQMESNRHGLVRLVAGHFGQNNDSQTILPVRYLPNGAEGQSKAGVFIVGFPVELDTHQNRLSLITQG